MGPAATVPACPGTYGHAHGRADGVHTGRQLALKVSANAIYGFTGAPSSKLQFRPIAETTIRTGADMLTRVRDLIQYASPHQVPKCPRRPRPMPPLMSTARGRGWASTEDR